MKIGVSVCVFFCITVFFNNVFSQGAKISSPDNQLVVEVNVKEGVPMYTVAYNGSVMLEGSPLGLMTNEGDFSTGMKLTGSKDSTVSKNYSQQKIKKSQVQYSANQLTCSFENARQRKMKIVFLVSNNDIAFRYELVSCHV